MEKKQKEKSGVLGDVSAIVLGLIAVTGILALAAVAPNAMRLLKYTPLFRRQKCHYVNVVVTRCIRQGLIKQEQDPVVGKVLRLTEKGRDLLMQYRLKHITLATPRRWDKKYRIIIFDIKETRRGARDTLRIWLTQLGFIQLQRSVWVYPYECQEVVTLLKAHIHIGKDVLYLTADFIENDRWLRKAFDLPLK
ncbi:MAG TPA: hypothetical protein DCZ84_00690 [Candidatus Vogelbacteria bacterium]|uniref:Transcriptional repressor PaaX-like central Cas2-like domain-containing protein n=1 Tax=Candidatus Vogelbacteria bacterium RIFOXYD1_FULL_51_18 TaxID=1802440 RepID=A0A1G2QK84_9BACT|nr:MAG: Phenylacetic acid degradation operon negative regulatory protein [Parcubacteria group bacterium GW2011_GWC1_51_35]KKW24740.1 MAG: Phenylacetic acid degradation operon negative regulatory protein [Parcubacteria group bacterium GW2011_GWF2_52_12]KKW34589.1 MAG: Phenylacetic acid degradation operon negative regulatory protein [Parcubacteria group bacterium GW2011_GWB1_53_43]KKW38379.1 MAG: Phenylacetic acid degradation operon negative regulatory protein [Parcubacteria group bacterium GW2011